MSALLTIHELSKAFATQILFEKISFTLHQGDRIGLIGPNGCGKSTLLKIILGQEPADSGYIAKKQGLTIGYASQAPEFASKSLEEILLQGPSPGNEQERQTRARTLLSKAQFQDFSANASTLSGGGKKRLDIALALMQEPDLLLLDEPTNHLDLEGIFWLEKFLQREKISYLVISHDRYFLEQVCNKTIEINRCYPQGLLACEGSISSFYQHKEAFLKAQAERQRSLSSLVRDEVDWLRRSPKARTSKSQARVQKAHELIQDLHEVKERNRVFKLDIEFSASERETRNLIVANNLTKSLGGKPLFKGIDLKLSPGSRLGIAGRNGSGKTTLLKVLAGQMIPDAGTLKIAPDLKLVYFDQHREQIPSQFTLKEALSPMGEVVNYRGQPIHVNGWAKRFLFSPDKLNMPIKYLSGGERARIQIARLMLEPADVLFLDEPTNDLDISTLEVIEESLSDFPGAVVLISHDRCLMDRVCNQVLGLGGQATAHFYADYKQWERALQALESKAEQQPTLKNNLKNRPKEKTKLSYKEQRELEGMEKAIEKQESLLHSLYDKLQSKTNQQQSLDLYHELGKAQRELDALYERWQTLLDQSMN